jgi:hypothetical protein
MCLCVFRRSKRVVIVLPCCGVEEDGVMISASPKCRSFLSLSQVHLFVDGKKNKIQIVGVWDVRVYICEQERSPRSRL